ncbi:hypothetical protein BRCON_1500 [Candidatus Sumerlaea chitinivorans]|uniref:Uncharacterized protein n=1 Tax=Sumerlaea chitinivorans TaxID=2250252 RepID=A0A2Z4Y4Z6_SUMC1|nr:hypothetical protein BRCON_1500 [Candidatus Sumerlaea chitinivorans]
MLTFLSMCILPCIVHHVILQTVHTDNFLQKIYGIANEK